MTVSLIGILPRERKVPPAIRCGRVLGGGLGGSMDWVDHVDRWTD